MKIYTKTKIYQRFVKKLGNCEDRPNLYQIISEKFFGPPDLFCSLGPGDLEI